MSEVKVTAEETVTSPSTPDPYTESFAILATLFSIREIGISYL
jgi:hypothetical protein